MIKSARIELFYQASGADKKLPLSRRGAHAIMRQRKNGIEESNRNKNRRLLWEVVI
jgi:hypothetical protein